MRLFAKINIPLLGALFFVLGCASDNGPTPADTVLDNPSRPMGWISEDEVYSDSSDSVYMVGGYYSEGGQGYGSEENLPNRETDTVRLTGKDGERVLDVVYFGFDQYSVRPSERTKVESMADYLRNHPGTTLIAEGHTDWRGTTQYNLALGDRRANAVKSYLVQLGIAPERIQIRSLGALDAVQGVEKNDADAIKDRKVKMIIVTDG